MKINKELAEKYISLAGYDDFDYDEEYNIVTGIDYEIDFLTLIQSENFIYNFAKNTLPIKLMTDEDIKNNIQLIQLHQQSAIDNGDINNFLIRLKNKKVK